MYPDHIKRDFGNDFRQGEQTQLALKTDITAGAAADGWSVLVTDIIGRKHIMG